MSRVLVIGGTGALGAAVVRRLLGDPNYDVRVADERPAPQWMRESCEIHGGDLRDPERARRAVAGCAFVVQLAAAAGRPFGAIETTIALVRAALDGGVERFAHVSVSGTAVASGGEAVCRAAGAEHGLPFTICRALGAYGPGDPADLSPEVGRLIEQALAARRPLELPAVGEHAWRPIHVDDVADGIVAALSSPAARDREIDLHGPDELTFAELAGLIWEAAGNDPASLELRELPGVASDGPAARESHRLPGWEPRIGVRDGIAQTLDALREVAKTSIV